METHLSCQEVVASCPEEAFPLELRDQEAFPSEGPLGAASQGGVPSYLEEEESGGHTH